jgi:60S ribosome subunit biogenesis protein NIP7
MSRWVDPRHHCASRVKRGHARAENQRVRLTNPLLTGKFSKSGKFRLHITSLPVLAAHARYKIWIRPNGTMPFLYGGNIVKAHVGRWSEDCPEHQGVVVYDMNDTPLGFGVTARSTSEARRLDPTGVVCFRQADCGEFLRDEDTLFAS